MKPHHQQPSPRLKAARTIAVTLLISLLPVGLVQADTVGGAAIVVTTLTDEDDGLLGGSSGVSLREAVKYASPGADITIAGGIGRSMNLTLGALRIEQDLTIDASSLSKPLWIDANGGPRVFDIISGTCVVLRHLIISGGNAGATNGGGIYTDGELTLEDCTVRDNTANCAGGITNGGNLTLIRSTLFGNTATDVGGAICNGNVLTIRQCTFSGNHSVNRAGAIANWGPLDIQHATIANNTAVNFEGGIAKYAGTLTMGYTIVAGNHASSTPNLLGAIDTPTGPNVTSGDPLLAPLDTHGGITRTMPPLRYSPAINPATDSGVTTDQRGFSRSGTPDIGAAEYGPVVQVISINDSGPGSLRHAVAIAAEQGGVVEIAPQLGGQTVTLTSGPIAFSGKESLLVDASGFSNGFTVSGDDQFGVFTIAEDSSAILHGFTITEGHAASGGGIYNAGQLHLIGSTVCGNRAADGAFSGGSGGGIMNLNDMTITASTVSDNQSGEGPDSEGGPLGGSGAGIMSLGRLVVDRSTIVNNVCAPGGLAGGLYNGFEGSLTVTHSTITGNQSSEGGGVFSTGDFILRHSILTFNLAPSFSNIAGFFNSEGTNNVTDDDPILAPLGNYGGPTETMPPLSSSPSIDQGIGSQESIDQRGFSRDGVPDLGAVEYKPLSMSGVVWEDLDADGVRTANDAVIAGAQILLFNAEGTSLIASVMSAADGSYSVSEADGLIPGEQIMALNLPALDADVLWTATLRDAGSDESTDSDLLPCDLTAGRCLLETIQVPTGLFQFDAGVARQELDRGGVTGQLWHDENDDSFRIDEPGFGNGTVELLAGDTGDRVAMTSTDPAGNYQFLNLLPGNYQVRFLLPPGMDHFTGPAGDSEVSFYGYSLSHPVAPGGAVSVSAGVTDQPPVLAQQPANDTALRTAPETAQGLRLHRDAATGETTLRWTILPLMRNSDGKNFFPRQWVETSRDLVHWEHTGIVLSATTSGQAREERVPVQLDPSQPTFLRIRVASPTDPTFD